MSSRVTGRTQSELIINAANYKQHDTRRSIPVLRSAFFKVSFLDLQEPAPLNYLVTRHNSAPYSGIIRHRSHAVTDFFLFGSFFLSRIKQDRSLCLSLNGHGEGRDSRLGLSFRSICGYLSSFQCTPQNNKTQNAESYSNQFNNEPSCLKAAAFLTITLLLFITPGWWLIWYGWTWRWQALGGLLVFTPFLLVLVVF